MKTKTQTKHTPLPWNTDFKIDNKGSMMVYGPQSMPACILYVGDNEANAEFIVKACNSHYELIEALKEVRQVLGAINEEYNIDLSDIDNQIEQALSKAEG